MNNGVAMKVTKAKLIKNNFRKLLRMVVRTSSTVEPDLQLWTPKQKLLND